MSPPKSDAGADAMKRIRRLARDRGEDVQLLLLPHVNERLLFRLASSAHAPGIPVLPPPLNNHIGDMRSSRLPCYNLCVIASVRRMR